MFEEDELKIYRGADIKITPKITVTQPTIGQIEEFGEKKYFNAVHTLTATGADLKWQLWDYAGIDYTQIDDYELFVTFIWQIVSSRRKAYEELMSDKEKYAEQLASITEEELENMKVNPLQLVLKDVDLGNFVPCTLKETEEVILYDPEHDITIDRAVYSQIVDVVRRIHGLKRNNQIPANQRTKMDLIEDARDDALRASREPYKSALKPLVSALMVKSNMCGDKRIWDMNINMFFDSIKRINKIQDSILLLQGAYSGFASLKGIDKTRLDWAGEI